MIFYRVNATYRLKAKLLLKQFQLFGYPSVFLPCQSYENQIVIIQGKSINGGRLSITKSIIYLLTQYWIGNVKRKTSSIKLLRKDVCVNNPILYRTF